MLKGKIENATGKRVLFLSSYVEDGKTVYAVEFSDGSQADFIANAGGVQLIREM